MGPAPQNDVMTRDHDPASTDSSSPDRVDDILARWWLELSRALDLPDVPVERGTLLGLAGEAAHGVVRPAAPLTTFLVGYAAGRAGGGSEELQSAVATASEAVRRRASTS